MLRVIPGQSARPDLTSKYLLFKKIEAVLYEHPLVAEAAVRFTGENVLTAFIVPDNEKLSVAGLKQFLSGRLAPEERPQIYRFVAGIPKTLSGKCPQLIAEQTL